MFSQDAMDHADSVLRQVRESWMERAGVTAVDLGFKWSDGQMTDQLAIRVHVNKKLPLLEIAEEDRFPKEVEGVPVDVIEATYGVQELPNPESQLEFAVDGRHRRFDDIPIGVSIGSPNTTAGTLGAKVFDEETGQAMILSNWHILVGALPAVTGTPIWQPGAADGGRSDNNIFAELARFILGPYDAAVAKLTGSRPVKSETLEGTPIEDVTSPQLGMRVWKSGRTTGLTQGFIDGINMTLSMNYGAAGVRTLRDVLRIIPVPGSPPTEISAGGDSGSVWVDQVTGKAIGLHFGGEVGNAPEHALANDIVPVINWLQVQFPAQREPEVPIPDPIPDPDPVPDPIPDPVPDPDPIPDPAPLPDPIPDPDPTPVPDDPVEQPQLSVWQRFLQWLSRLFR